MRGVIPFPNRNDSDELAACGPLPSHATNAIVCTAIDSTAKGANVARRRFQRGSVFKNKARTVWLGMYSEYFLDPNGVERRRRRQIVLGPVRKSDGSEMTKREAQRLLQPYVDRVNASISAPAREHKSITLEAFSKVWDRDYLSLSKPSTRCTMRGHLKRLVTALGKKDMRQIDAGDLQRVIASMEAEGLEPKTIRNFWATVRLIWGAALAQKYVDSLLPKPKLPRLLKKRPRYFRLEDVGRVIASSQGELRMFLWLNAEAGPRAGEMCALRLEDVEPDRLTINQTVWHGRFHDSTKTPCGTGRIVALSARLGAMLKEQVERQREKGHDLLFSSDSGKPWDSGVLVRRKLRPLLLSLGIPQAGLHAFRHFNASLLSALRVPLKTIQERLGHAYAGSLTLDVYTHSEWEQNVEAAQLAGTAIEKAVDFVSLTAIQQEGPADRNQQALEAA